MRKPTIADLQDRIRHLEPYREAYHCLRRGSPIHVVTCEDRSISLIGVERAAGGVVLAVNGEDCCPQYLTDWTIGANVRHDPYFAEVARKAHKLQKDAIDARLASSTRTTAPAPAADDCAACEAMPTGPDGRAPYCAEHRSVNNPA